MNLSILGAAILIEKGNRIMIDIPNMMIFRQKQCAVEQMEIA